MRRRRTKATAKCFAFHINVIKLAAGMTTINTFIFNIKEI